MEPREYVKLAPMVRDAPHRYLWSSYDEEADTLYINFKKPSRATDSESLCEFHLETVNIFDHRPEHVEFLEFGLLISKTSANFKEKTSP